MDCHRLQRMESHRLPGERGSAPEHRRRPRLRPLEPCTRSASTLSWPRPARGRGRTPWSSWSRWGGRRRRRPTPGCLPPSSTPTAWSGSAGRPGPRAPAAGRSRTTAPRPRRTRRGAPLHGCNRTIVSQLINQGTKCTLQSIDRALSSPRRAWELPWIEGGDVGDGDDALDVAAADAVELVPEVEADELLLRGVEAEPGGQIAGHGGVISIRSIVEACVELSKNRVRS
jgi:hypothetical protein